MHFLAVSVYTDYVMHCCIFIRPITDNLNATGHAVGQDSETKSTEPALNTNKVQ